MGLSFNGTDIDTITFNGTELTSVTFNGTEVWSAESPVVLDDCLYVQNNTSSNVALYFRGYQDTETDKPLDVKWSTDSGATWTSFVYTAGRDYGETDKVIIPSNTKMYLRGDNPYGFNYSSRRTYTGDWYTMRLNTSSYKDCDVGGNIMSLLDNGTGSGMTSIPSDSVDCFRDLFSTCYMNGTFANLLLPATTLGTRCYYRMFNTSHISAPPQVLPAYNVSESAYEMMFYQCTYMTTTPKICATYVGESGMKNMFYGCTAITSLPVLFVNSISASDYTQFYRTFYGCSALYVSDSWTSSTGYITKCPMPNALTNAIATTSEEMFQGTLGTKATTSPLLTTQYKFWTQNQPLFVSPKFVCCMDGIMYATHDCKVWYPIETEKNSPTYLLNKSGHIFRIATTGTYSNCVTNAELFDDGTSYATTNGTLQSYGLAYNYSCNSPLAFKTLSGTSNTFYTNNDYQDGSYPYTWQTTRTRTGINMSATTPIRVCEGSGEIIGISNSSSHLWTLAQYYARTLSISETWSFQYWDDDSSSNPFSAFPNAFLKYKYYRCAFGTNSSGKPVVSQDDGNGDGFQNTKVFTSDSGAFTQAVTDNNPTQYFDKYPTMLIALTSAGKIYKGTDYDFDDFEYTGTQFPSTSVIVGGSDGFMQIAKDGTSHHSTDGETWTSVTGLPSCSGTPTLIHIY